MEDSILYALYLKQLQLGFVAACIMLASILSIYNLPWSEIEFGYLSARMKNMIRTVATSTKRSVQTISEDVGQKMT